MQKLLQKFISCRHCHDSVPPYLCDPNYFLTGSDPKCGLQPKVLEIKWQIHQISVAV